MARIARPPAVVLPLDAVMAPDPAESVTATTATSNRERHRQATRHVAAAVAAVGADNYRQAATPKLQGGTGSDRASGPGQAYSAAAQAAAAALVSEGDSLFDDLEFLPPLKLPDALVKTPQAMPFAAAAAGAAAVPPQPPLPAAPALPPIRTVAAQAAAPTSSASISSQSSSSAPTSRAGPEATAAGSVSRSGGSGSAMLYAGTPRPAATPRSPVAPLAQTINRNSGNGSGGYSTGYGTGYGAGYGAAAPAAAHSPHGHGGRHAARNTMAMPARGMDINEDIEDMEQLRALYREEEEMEEEGAGVPGVRMLEGLDEEAFEEALAMNLSLASARKASGFQPTLTPILSPEAVSGGHQSEGPCGGCDV